MAGQATADSGVLRRVLGRYLRGLRQQARLTTKAAAGLLEWSEPKLWRIETGQTVVRSLDVEAMCAAYGAPADVTGALAGLAKQVRAGGQWHPYGQAISGDFSVYAELENEASELLGYAYCQVPALLQTGAYARTLIMTARPGIGTDEVERLVSEYLSRQVMVTRASAPLPVTVILSEALVRCPVGGADVMAEQLRHLAGLAALPNVRLRVIPVSAGMHPGVVTGPFTLLRFPLDGHGKETDPDTVCISCPSGELYLDQPDEVQPYRDAHAGMLGCALDQVASQDLLLAVAKELAGSDRPGA
jgi:transcriptional regulator with XRE-family HTH domain